jgi:fatty acid CoA ligase FadD9
VHFVSTSAVAAGVRGVVAESARAERLWSRRPIEVPRDKSYAAGYAASKWAAEVLLADLHASCNVPVDIVRCSMLLPHREYDRVVNVDDAFARLIYGIVRTGVAPDSFYASDYRGRRHYDGVPVDLAARSIAEVCRTAHNGFRIYHVSNSNWDDGVSLDTIVGWIESAGYPVQRLSYPSWYAEFVRRLGVLTPEERRRSAAPIVFRWREPTRAGAHTTLATRNFEAVLATLGIEAIPNLDEAYVHQCVRGICGDPA